MESLDYKYIANLVTRAQAGDSDAFAELYAATYQRVYMFSYRYLRDEYLAQDALQETYILALKNLSKLKDPMLVISWLNQINFRVCYKLQKEYQCYNQEIEQGNDYLDTFNSDRYWGGYSGSRNTTEDLICRIDSQEYLVNQIMKLPFTESQVILLKYYKDMKLDEIAILMDISKSSVKRYLKAGRERLAQVLQQI